MSAAAVAGKASLKVGDEAPDVFGRSSKGEVVHLANYRGKIVVISFWASWCGPCRKELPLLMTLQKKATPETLVVLSVNWRQSYQEFRQITKILARADSSITLISDESGHAGNAYGVDAIPHMLILGRDGKIAAIHVGYGEEEIPQLVEEINSTWTRSAPQDTVAN